jgi:hypothetical protein
LGRLIFEASYTVVSVHIEVDPQRPRITRGNTLPT